MKDYEFYSALLKLLDRCEDEILEDANSFESYEYHEIKNRAKAEVRTHEKQRRNV